MEVLHLSPHLSVGLVCWAFLLTVKSDSLLPTLEGKGVAAKSIIPNKNKSQIFTQSYSRSPNLPTTWRREMPLLSSVTPQFPLNPTLPFPAPVLCGCYFLSKASHTCNLGKESPSQTGTHPQRSPTGLIITLHTFV